MRKTLNWGKLYTVAQIELKSLQWARGQGRLLEKAEKASEKILAAAKLQRLDPSNSESIMAGELWKLNGAVVMAVRRPG